MKLFMCVNYPIYNSAIGISKKIKSQIENFEKLGFEVTYSAYIEDGISIYTGDSLVYEKKFSSLIPDVFYGVARRYVWLSGVKDFLRKNNNTYDVGFIRWGAVDGLFISTLKAMSCNCDKIILDCHGYSSNYKGFDLKGLYIEKTTKRNSNKIVKYINVCLTETKETELFGIPAIPMDTGIDVDKYKPHVYSGNSNEIHMISVANELPYHGYDRIIKGLANYRGSNVYLHLVGKMSKKTIKLIQDLELGNRVFLHGYKTGSELEEIYNKANIGVGPLAPHRVGGKEGTGIKTKEFFAIGLPYFFAGQELKVPDIYPYVLKLKDDESPIDVADVVCFYNSIKCDLDMQSNMRCFARDNYSWENVFKKALNTMGVNGF